MTGNFTICVGTVGSGAWLSPDGGESWRRVGKGLGNESRVFGLTVHPRPRMAGRAKGGRLSVAFLTLLELIRIAPLVRWDEMKLARAQRRPSARGETLPKESS